MVTIVHIIRRAWQETKELHNIFNMPLAITLIYIIESGRGRLLYRLNKLIPVSKLPLIVSYYFSHVCYLHGEYEKARHHLYNIIKTYPLHADSTYLLCSILDAEGKKNEALTMIKSLALSSKRLKTWLVMANLVTNTDDFHLLYDTWQNAIVLGHASACNFDVTNYIATGALRAGCYNGAIDIWKKFNSEQSKINYSVKLNSRNNFNIKLAERALLDIKKILDDNRIVFFLISGTLLGCIREGGILPHDKDIDIGVWNSNKKNRLAKLFGTSGLFYIQAPRTPHTIRIKHVNGISTDIFIHYRNKNNYWHAGVKLKWNNTPFKLAPHPFLGTYFNIPKNYNLYLKENYGDWRTPNNIFDSSTDTTNSSILNKYELIVHHLKKDVMSNLATTKKH